MRSSESGSRYDDSPPRSPGEPSPSTSIKAKRGRNASRVGMACIPCRQSKLKCDGAKPLCQRCTKRSLSCYWADLDGRSTEAKRTRRASEVGIPYDEDADITSAHHSIAQLELLANAAVGGGHSSAAGSVGSSTSFHLSASSAVPAQLSADAPPSPPLRLSQPLPPRSAAAMSAFPTPPSASQGFLPPSVSTPVLNTPSIFTPNADANNAGAPHLWWERYGTANTKRSTPTGAPVMDPLMMNTWSSLGLEPQHMTGDMLDMLTGKVVWVDQPRQSQSTESSGGGDGSTAHNQTNTLTPFSAAQSHSDANADNAGWQGQTSNGKSRSSSTSQDASTANGLVRPAADVVRLQYFRLLGPTGISPGIKKISMELKLTPSVRKALFDSDSSLSTSRQGAQRVDWERLIADVGGSTGAENGSAPAIWDAPGSEEESDVAAAGQPDFFDGDTPARWVLDELLPIFFDRLGDHYLCLDRHGLETRLGLRQGSTTQSTTASASRSVQPMLINVMCALAARFSKHPHIVAGRAPQRAHSFGKLFARKAKDFLATSLAVPTRSTTLAFLMMAWHEFACNLDSAFWNYGGMALRMAIDLGLQRISHATRAARDMNESDLIDDALLFWAVYQMDRILVVGTGRPTSIKDREITTPYPSIDDVPTNDNIIFGYYIRHVRIGGRIAEAINATLLPDDEISEESARELDGLETELIQSYESIPARLRLNTANFKRTEQKHLFLEFHLWFHNLLFILNRSPIVEMRKSVHHADAVKMVRKSVQRCADVVALDDAYDNRILESVPMANQTLFLAGCTELEESRESASNSASPAVFHGAADGGNGNGNSNNGHVSSRHLMLEAEDGYQKFASALERISIYWDGVRWIHGVLTQRKMGRSHTDLVELAVGTDALVSKRELQLLQRLSTGGGGGGGSALQRSTTTTANDSGLSSATTFSKQDALSPSSRLPVEISDVASLDELASLLPQVQAILASQPSQPPSAY